MKSFFLSLTGMVFLLQAGSAVAAPKFEFDKTHTVILFFVDHLGFSKTSGEFREYDGYFTFDEANPENSEVMVTINPASVDTVSQGLDDHLLNEDFFNVEAFPTVTFKSTKVEVTGDNTGIVHGDFTLLGVTKPLALDVTFNKADFHPMNKKYVAGFSATGIIKRSEYGMNYGIPNVGDAVELRIEVEGIDPERTMDEKESDKQ